MSDASTPRRPHPGGRPRLAAEPLTQLSARITVPHFDRLATLAHGRRQSVAEVVRTIITDSLKTTIG
jgi:hypothetical protein